MCQTLYLIVEIEVKCQGCYVKEARDTCCIIKLS
jgi:hypothetical protein